MSIDKHIFTGNLFRAGDVIYGGHKGDYEKDHFVWDFEPALEWVSEICEIKEYPKDSFVSYNKSY